MTLRPNDGSATFATDINPNLLVGVALHELDPRPWPRPLWASARYFSTCIVSPRPACGYFRAAPRAPAAYFSLDGGVTRLADFGPEFRRQRFSQRAGQHPDPGTILLTNSITAVRLQVLSAVDKQILRSAGLPYHATCRDHGNRGVRLDQSRPGRNRIIFSSVLREVRAPSSNIWVRRITANQFPGWAPLAAEPTANGYEVAWTACGSGQIYGVERRCQWQRRPLQIVSSVSGTSVAPGIAGDKFPAGSQRRQRHRNYRRRRDIDRVLGIERTGPDQQCLSDHSGHRRQRADAQISRRQHCCRTVSRLGAAWRGGNCERLSGRLEAGRPGQVHGVEYRRQRQATPPRR